MSEFKILPPDLHPYHFKLYLKDSEIAFLKKYNFSEKVPNSSILDEEKELILKYAKMGFLERYRDYVIGTGFYEQLKESWE